MMFITHRAALQYSYYCSLSVFIVALYWHYKETKSVLCNHKMSHWYSSSDITSSKCHIGATLVIQASSVLSSTAIAISYSRMEQDTHIHTGYRKPVCKRMGRGGYFIIII